MKFKSFFIASSLALGLTQICFGQAGTIVGSKHDFSLSNNTWNFSAPITAQLQGQICRPCHAPHNSNNGDLAKTNYTDNAGLFGPLWDHSLSSVSNYAIYTGYNFNRPGGGGATIGQPDGSSKLCLSCHDGTVALANFRSYTTGTTTMANFNGGAANLGTDLSTTHPVSFTYDQALSNTDHKIWDPTTTPSGVHSGTIDGDMLEFGKVQCISCHDAHNGAGVNHLLIKSNVGSALCFTCHKL
jgi:predicted CXXCH cytochrome family protein